MIEIVSDLHTHTLHSHGSGTVEDNVKAAIAKGLKQIAISDHGVGHLFFNIKNLDAYFADIHAMKEKYKNEIEVLSGVELNILAHDGTIDLPPQYADLFDVKLLGYHKLVRYRHNALHFLLPKSHSEKAILYNTQTYKNVMDKNHIDIITHIGYGLPADKIEVAKYAAKKGVALEINAKHPEFSIEELKECAKAGVKFVIGSDAHSAERVGDFKNALLKAQAANIPVSQIINAKTEA
ncbi:MAG: PHP domain-containing protein [Christensenellaceae bacterium]